ncbi:MAG: FAD-binding oxidoreductase [Tahibacter sp.]
MSQVGTPWGRYPRAQQRVVSLRDRHADLPSFEGTALPHGNGRSYGDSCTNDGGTLLHTRGLDRFIAFDAATGVLSCEAGVLLSDILDFAIPQGWFVPVLPGTRFITVGGAIANDVHGKNHHRAGCFSEHLDGFELLRTDGLRRWCSLSQNPDWYAATVGGLGLTGVITWAQLRLSRIRGPWMNAETLRFSSVSQFIEISSASERDYEYSVAWVDCAAAGKTLGRGLFMRANHAPAGCGEAPRSRLAVPFTPPISLINGLSLRAFNALYYHRQRSAVAYARSHYQPYFFPLDSIADWNRVYGPKGFVQYQCVVPPGIAETAIQELLARIAASGQGSFLAVLKVFGERRSAGILSFPRPGATLALDFPNAGKRTFDLLDTLDTVVAQAGGAVYPAKDARLPGRYFRQYYPEWETLRPYLDPKFSSGFWRRVTE